MKILLTGASGYVGSYVYEKFKNGGFDIVGTYNSNKQFDGLVQVDLTDEKQVKDLLEKVNPDVIIHAEANAYSKTCEADPKNAKKLNVLATEYCESSKKE